MKQKRTYCDSSVIGGLIDEEFADHSARFVDNAAAGIFHIVISPVVDDEIRDPATPAEVIERYEKILDFAEFVEVSDDAIELQQAYIREGILTEQWRDDALHVALATVNCCDLVVSWNFKHIVNYQKIPLYNAVNKLLGYGEIQIYSPLELVVSNED